MTRKAQVKTARENPKYTIKFGNVTEKQYDEIHEFIGRLSHHRGFDETYNYHFMNRGGTQAVRFNRKNLGIELSDRVEPFVEVIIRDIIKTESKVTESAI